MLASVLLVALTLGCTLGNRMEIQSHNLESSSTDASEAAAWTLSFSRIPCFLPHDLSSLGVFAKGLTGKTVKIPGKIWDGKAELSAELVKKGREVASKRNCKRCNIQVLGFMPETALSVEVKCAMEKKDPPIQPRELADNCFDEHGNLGMFLTPSNHGACMPCPVECELGCEAANDMLSSNWFKCITRNPGKVAEEKVFKGAGGCMLASGYECEGSAFGKLSQDVQTILSVGNSFEKEQQVPKFQRSKKHSNEEQGGAWKLRLKYKDHAASWDPETRLTTTLDDEAMGSTNVEGSTWMLDTGISSCTVEPGSLQKLPDGDSSFNAVLAKGAAALMQTQATSQNCLICNTKYGGRVQQLLSFSESAVVTDLTGKNSFEADLWAKVDCATEELGTAACNLMMGSVGWSTLRTCMPCPQECMRCEEMKSGKHIDTEKFKCALLPMIKFPTPSMASLTTENGGTAPEGLYKPPTDFKCDEPTPRKCGSSSRKKGWCRTWQYKTECEYKQER